MMMMMVDSGCIVKEGMMLMIKLSVNLIKQLL